MGLTLGQFRINFGQYPVPSLLENLLAFQNASPEWYSLGFELSTISQKDLRHHVSEEVISQIFGFGHDGNYSIYALWRYKEMSLDEAPVVYFNSEGQGSGMLANNLTEFLRLLAYDEEPILGVYPDRAEDDNEHTKRNAEFRVWLEQHYHLHVAKHPNDVVLQARRHHPAVPLIYPHGLDACPLSFPPKDC